MNNAQLYLAWLRTTSPDIYITAMRKVLRQPRTLGGLDSDLVDSMTAPNTFGAFGQDTLPEITVYGDTPSDTSFEPQLQSFDISTDYPDLAQVNPVDAGTPNWTITDTSTPAAGGSWLSSFITTVGSVASTALTSSTQSNLVKLNTTRAQQGLPPVDINGRVVTAAGLHPATGAIYNLERSIAGVTGGLSPMLLLAGVGLLAFVLLKRK